MRLLHKKQLIFLKYLKSRKNINLDNQLLKKSEHSDNSVVYIKIRVFLFSAHPDFKKKET